MTCQDIYNDLPRYRVFKNGEIIDEPLDVIQYRDQNLVAFLVGCSTNNDIGIKDMYHPDMFSFHEHIEPIEPNEVIMSWACGVTPQIVALSSKIPFMISHCPRHMFVTDKLSEELAVL